MILMKLLLISLLLWTTAFSQSERLRWEKASVSYKVDQSSEARDYSYTSKDISHLIVKSFTNVYWFLISDQDGDNCPFYPSCSSFLVNAVEETNLIQGTLMFFDRFTRDASFAGRHLRYSKHISGRLYDPSCYYTFLPPKYSLTETIPVQE